MVDKTKQSDPAPNPNEKPEICYCSALPKGSGPCLPCYTRWRCSLRVGGGSEDARYAHTLNKFHSDLISLRQISVSQTCLDNWPEPSGLRERREGSRDPALSPSSGGVLVFGGQVLRFQSCGSSRQQSTLMATHLAQFSNGSRVRTDEPQKEPRRVPTARRQVPRDRAHGLGRKWAGQPAVHGANLAPYSGSPRSLPRRW